MTRKQNDTLKQELRYFSGSEQFYYHPLFKSYAYTEGVQYLAQEAQSYWFLELIFSHQSLPKAKEQAFQAWCLKRKEDYSATITLEDGNKNPVLGFNLPFTDFPLNEITLWFVGETLLLPSEY